MKKINLLILTLVCSLVLTMSVSAETKSGNFFDCSGATSQCISCTYKDMTYYVKGDGKGNGSVAWKTDKATTGSYGGAKSESVSYTDFCTTDCKSLRCVSSVYMYADNKGTTIYSVREPSAANKGSVSLSSSNDNGKPFKSEGGSSNTRQCSYNTYVTKQGSSDPEQTGKKFIVTLDADGNFSMTYDGKNVANASSLANKGNITKEKFANGCPDLWVSCPTQNANGVICSASDTDIYHGKQDASGTQPGRTVPDRELTEGQVESMEFLEICDVNVNPTIVGSFRLAGHLIKIAKIIVPIFIIFWGMLDLSKAVVDGKDDAVKKAAFTFGKRVVIGTLVFLAPSIIFGLFDFVTGWAGVKQKYQTCVECLEGKDSCPTVNLVD